MKKRITSIIITAFMLAGLLASPAFAVSPETALPADVTEEILPAEPEALPESGAQEIPEEAIPEDMGDIEIVEVEAAQADSQEPQAELQAALPDATQLKGILDQISAYQLANVKSPKFSVAHGEWTVLGLARYGSITKEFQQTYLGNLYAELQDKEGALTTTLYTDYSRVVLALSAIGVDPINVNGYNVLLPLADYTNVSRQGPNGLAWALIALDAKQYEVPKTTAKVSTTRSKLVSAILERQLPDGGWALLPTAQSGDSDLTGMVVTALAPYAASNANARAAIDRALAFSSAKQDKYGGWGNCEATVQTIVALNAMGIALNDARFVKNGKTAYDDLMRYYKPDGSFSHSAGGSPNPMATDQGMYALTSYYRSITGQSALYDMRDKETPPPEDKKERNEVIGAIKALPKMLGIADKGNVALLAERLRKLADFSGKAFYTKIINNAKAAIARIEATVKQLDEDIWNKLNPKNITKADAETIATLLATYIGLNEADRAYVQNAQSLLDAKEILDALGQRVISQKVFERIRGSEDSYTYEDEDSGQGYSMHIDGRNVTAPADMNAALSIGNTTVETSIAILKNAYWISFAQQGALPGTITVSAQVGAADGAYTLYRYAAGKLQRIAAVNVQGSNVEFSTAQGGDYVLLAVGKKATIQINQTKKGKAEELKKSIFEEMMGQDINLRIEGETKTGEAYRLTFNGEDIVKPMELNTEVSIGGKNASNINKLAESPFIVCFGHEGELPGKMLVEIETALPDGEYLLFYYNEKTMRAEPDQKAVVEGGWASFFMTHCSDWFVAKRAKKASVLELMASEKEDAAGAAVAKTTMDVPEVDETAMQEEQTDNALPIPPQEQQPHFAWLLIAMLCGVAVVVTVILLYKRNERVKKA